MNMSTIATIEVDDDANIHIIYHANPKTDPSKLHVVETNADNFEPNAVMKLLSEDSKWLDQLHNAFTYLTKEINECHYATLQRPMITCGDDGQEPTIFMGFVDHTEANNSYHLEFNVPVNHLDDKSIEQFKMLETIARINLLDSKLKGSTHNIWPNKAATLDLVAKDNKFGTSTIDLCSRGIPLPIARSQILHHWMYNLEFRIFRTTKDPQSPRYAPDIRTASIRRIILTPNLEQHNIAAKVSMLVVKEYSGLL